MPTYKEHLRASLLLSDIPAHMHDGILRYLDEGIPPGDFLRCVLNNDLAGACNHADDINRHQLYNFCKWLYNFAPCGSWGHPGAVQEWCARRKADIETEKARSHSNGNR